MRIKSTSLLSIMAVTLCASVAANVAASIDFAFDLFLFFVWIHVAVIVFGGWGFIRMRRLRGTWSEVITAFLPLPKWILVVSIVVIITASYRITDIAAGFDMGTLPDGIAVHSKSWEERGGRYWVVLNRKIPVEISEAEYRALNRESLGFFAFSWLIFSFLGILQWHYIVRREALSNEDLNL